MRLIEYKGKKAYLTEQEVKSLIDRVDPDKGWEEDTFSQRVIKSKPCILCMKVHGDCRKCPLGIWEDVNNLGCEVLLKAIGVSGGVVHLFERSIIYFLRNKGKAKEELKKVQNALINLPKVNRRKVK